MPNENSTTMTYSVTSAKIPKGYIQRPTNYYFERKNYPYLMKKIQKYWLKDSTSFSHQRLKRLWQLWFLQIHIQLMDHIGTKPQTDHKFSEFNILSDHDVGQIVKKSATKSCILDPVPTSLLKEHLDAFIPTLADIINNSLQHGKFPEKLKNVAVDLF